MIDFSDTPGTPFGDGSVSVGVYLHDAPPGEALETFLDQARRLEQAGVDGVTVGEHHAGRRGYLPSPLLAASWLLEATTRVWVAPCPVLLPLRPYGLVAEELAWLAVRHEARVGAGFGPGYASDDFEVAGADLEQRRRAFAGALPLLAAALRGAAAPPLSRDRAVAACGRRPIPCVSAVDGPLGARRAAHAGVGMLTRSIHDSAPEVGALVEEYTRHGGTGPVVLSTRAWVSALSDRAGADPTGEARDIGRRLALLLQDSGATALNVKLCDPADFPDQSLSPPQVMADQVAAFGEVVLPAFRSERERLRLVATGSVS